MAKKKTVTKKEITEKPSDELDSAPTIISGEAFTTLRHSVKKSTESSEQFGKAISVIPSKEELQASYDQEVKDLLIKMGEVQSKYQQLGRTKKARALRDQKRLIQGKYKEWK